MPKRISSIFAERIQHLDTFITLYLQGARSSMPSLSLVLILALPSMPARSQLLPAAIDALSITQLAVKYRGDLLINKSRSLYSTALVQLLRALQTPVTPFEDETLLSAYLIMLCEVLSLGPWEFIVD
jgi:hypothetical protein